MHLNYAADPHAVLRPYDKGVPGHIAPLAASEVGAEGWNLLREDLPLPVAVLKEGALLRNAAWMKSFVDRHEVALAPHGKTTMAPVLFDLQMRHGAWGVTVSSPHQIAAALAAGFRRLFVANQIVGRSGIRFVLDLMERDADVYIHLLVDSVENVDQIAAIALEMGIGRPLPVLVELGFAGGRTGTRTIGQGLEVARAVAQCPFLELAGVEGFEGIIRRSGMEPTLDAVRAFLADVVSLAEACDSEGLWGDGAVLLSAGGSAFFDLVVTAFSAARLAVPTTILLRSGCYVTHDSGLYRKLFAALKSREPRLFEEGGPQAALEVWSYVQSRPEPGRVIATLGKRDVSHDDMPIPELWFRPGSNMKMPVPLREGHRVVALNDQHAFLDVPEDSPLQVGDMLSVGISHPCLTFDKWRVLHVVDDNYSVLGSLCTYF